MTNDDDDDLLAGEYVLGTLDTEARAAIAARRLRDGGLDASIIAWEARLAPLSEAAQDAEPSPDVWQTILSRISVVNRAPGIVTASDFALLRRRVTRWKRATAGALALAACLAGWIAAVDVMNIVRPAPTFVAFLQKDDDAPAYVMKANLDQRTLSVRPVAASAPPGKSYELWVIDPQIGAPKSLGVLDPSSGVHALPAAIPDDVLSRATYAVTTEQLGGSPSGAPTSPPVFFGHLIKVLL